MTVFNLLLPHGFQEHMGIQKYVHANSISRPTERSRQVLMSRSPGQSSRCCDRPALRHCTMVSPPECPPPRCFRRHARGRRAGLWPRREKQPASRRGPVKSTLNFSQFATCRSTMAAAGVSTSGSSDRSHAFLVMVFFNILFNNTGVQKAFGYAQQIGAITTRIPCSPAACLFR
jgi:hypothetical protein